MRARGGVLQPMRYDSSAGLGLGRGSVSGLAALPPPAEAAALLEVWRVVWVIGVGDPDDFNMASDYRAGGFVEDEHLARSSFLGEPDAEVPLACRRREVFVSPPGGGLFGVASSGPAQ